MQIHKKCFFWHWSLFGDFDSKAILLVLPALLTYGKLYSTVQPKCYYITPLKLRQYWPIQQ